MEILDGFHHNDKSSEVRYQYDVLLITSDLNYCAQKGIQSFLLNYDIRVATLDSHLGESIYRELETYLKKSKLVIFYCSKEVKNDKLLTALIESIVILWIESSANFGDLITLVSNPVTLMPCLVKTNKIYMDNPDWKDTLLQEIKREPRDTILTYSAKRLKSLCQISGNTFNNVILESNQNKDTLQYDLHGVKFTPQDITTPESSVVEVNLNLFTQNLKQHSEGTVRQICDIFDSLHTQEVRLKVIFDHSTKDIFDGMDNIFPLIADLFMCVCPVEEIIDIWLQNQQKENSSPEYHSLRLNTVEGPMTPYVQHVLHTLNDSIGVRHLQKIQKSQKQNSLYLKMKSKYSDLDKRRQTFIGRWDENVNPSIDFMAEAGLYMNQYGKVICFKCGHMIYRNVWARSDVLDKIEQEATNKVQYEHRQHEATNNKCRHKSRIQRSPSGNPHDLPKHFSDIKQREDSFSPLTEDYEKRFGENYQAMISALASAGFYNSNMKDCVLCYACFHMFSITGIKKARIWPLHAGMSPNCPHVVTVKGTDYVEEIQSAREAASETSSVTYFLKRSDREHSWQQNAINFPVLSFN